MSAFLDLDPGFMMQIYAGAAAGGIFVLIALNWQLIWWMVQWRSRDLRRKDEIIISAIHECISIIQAPPGDLSDTDDARDSSRFDVIIKMLRNKKMLINDVEGMPISYVAEYLSSLAPYVEAYGAKKASSMRAELANRLSNRH